MKHVHFMPTETATVRQPKRSDTRGWMTVQRNAIDELTRKPASLKLTGAILPERTSGTNLERLLTLPSASRNANVRMFGR